MSVTGVTLEITEGGIRLASAFYHYRADCVNDRDGLRQCCGPCSERLHQELDDYYINVAWPCPDYLWIVKAVNEGRLK